MYNILFTKYFSAQDVQEMISKSFKVRCEDFIKTDFTPHTDIEKQIPQGFNNFIITSYRAAQHISKLDLNGNFYCVGKKAATSLINNNKKVLCVANSAKELLTEIEKKIEHPSKLIYFCSDIRLDILPKGIKDLGHQYLEIVTYKINKRIVYITEDYDGYVFFSPSGVKSFAEQYVIPKKATIFAIGKTTSDVAKTVFNRDVIIPEKPDKQLLINTIKDYFHAKK